MSQLEAEKYETHEIRKAAVAARFQNIKKLSAEYMHVNAAGGGVAESCVATHDGLGWWLQETTVPAGREKALLRVVTPMPAGMAAAAKRTGYTDFNQADLELKILCDRTYNGEAAGSEALPAPSVAFRSKLQPHNPSYILYGGQADKNVVLRRTGDQIKHVAGEELHPNRMPDLDFVRNIELALQQTETVGEEPGAPPEATPPNLGKAAVAA